MSDVQDAVRDHYAAAAKQIAAGDDCSSSACCPPDYDAEDLIPLGVSEHVSLGCGNPTALAELRPGETVLDLGSGAGLDVLLSARRVGPGGHAYGVDMTDEMLELAQTNKARSGLTNLTFLKGTIDAVPLPEATVDVVISNCVINLAADKAAVIAEAFRVLRPGGRLAVADMVELDALAPEVKKATDAWAGCIAGTIPVEDYRQLLLAAGFENPEIQVHAVTNVPEGGRIGSAYLRALKPA